MAAHRLAAAALALLAVAALAKGPRPPPPGPLQRVAELKDSLAIFMADCVRRGRTLQDKLACRDGAKREFDNATTNDTDLSGGKGRVYFEKIQHEAAERKAKDEVRSCLTDASKTRAQMASCFSQAKARLSGELDNFIKPGKTAAQLAAQKAMMEAKAAREVLGDVFSTCVQAQSRDACKRLLNDRKQAAGLSGEDADSIVKRHFSRLLKGASDNCTSGDAKQCRDDAKSEAVRNGMKPHEYGAMKKLGEVKATAELWATCKEAGEDDATCEGMIRDEFVRVSGARPADFDEGMKSRVKSLGRAIKDGSPIVLVKFKRLLVEAFASSATCESALEALFATKALNVAMRNSTNVSRSIARKCRVVDQRPEYSCRVEVDLPDSEMEALSEAMASGMLGESLSRRLREAGVAEEVAEGLGRRLATVDEAFAAQETAECAQGDASCASGSLAPAPGPAPGPAGQTSGARRAVAAFLALAAAAGSLRL